MGNLDPPGYSGITLTGGEPLLRDDLEALAGLFTDSGMPVAVATNGTLLSADRAESLRDSGVRHFDIGFTEETDEMMLPVTRAIHTGASVTASVCVHLGNSSRAGTLVRKAAAAGADSVCINRFVPTGRGYRNRRLLELDDDSLLLALESIQEAVDQCPVHVYAGVPVDPGLAVKEDYPGIQFTVCRCGETKWAIDPAGNLRTCEQSDRRLGNLLEIPFSEAIRRRSIELREFRRAAASGCRFLR